VETSPTNLLETLMSEKVRVGTSTPKADPAGDYALELFGKAEKVKPGSQAALSGKALQLTGGKDSAKPPEGRNPYGWVMAEKKADVFLTYCTNALLAQKGPVPENRQSSGRTGGGCGLRHAGQQQGFGRGLAVRHVHPLSRGTGDSRQIRFRGFAGPAGRVRKVNSASNLKPAISRRLRAPSRPPIL
jgi:hypothetical protein